MKITKAGYSLWEALCVLGLISVLLILVPQPNLAHWREEYQFRAFCEQLSHQLLLTQSQAIIEQTPIRVIFSRELNRVEFASVTDLEHPMLLELPEQWQIVHFFQFYYLPNGHTNKFKSLYFTRLSTHERYQVNFQLGSGRFAIQH